MKKITTLLTILSLLIMPVIPAYPDASGIQTQDVKTAADCIAAGAPIADCLIQTPQIYDTLNNQQLSVTIANGIGGGAGQGIELLKNPGFENGGLNNWSNTGGTAATVTSGANLLFQTTSASWTASASGQLFESLAYVIQGLSNTTCSANVYYTYTGASGDYSLQVMDDHGNVLNSEPLPAQASANIPAQIVFPCGATPSDTLQWLLISNVASPSTIYFDNAHLGSFTTFQIDTSSPMTTTTITTSGCTPSANCSGGNYIPPANVAGQLPSQIEVEMAGGGGGGFNGGNGGTTTFGSFLTANGGNAGGSCNGGAGGTATVGSPAIQIAALQGGSGSSCNSGIGSSDIDVSTGSGGTNPFGGAGSGQLDATGYNGSPNTGGGGGGGSQTGGHGGGSSGSGGAGGYIDALINSPLASSYSFSVGAGGSPGGDAGYGGSGVIIIRERYSSQATAYLPNAGGLAAGDITATSSASCPLGTIAADGTSYTVAQYAALWAAIGYTYGGSGANFNVPDYRGLFLRGVGASGAGYLLQNGGTPTGAALGTYQQDSFASHSHSYVLGQSGFTYSGINTAGMFGTSGGVTFSTGATGGAETRGANLSVTYCIRTVPASPAPIVLTTPPAQAVPVSHNIAWTSSNVLTDTLTANTTYTFSGVASGQVLVVRLTNTGSYTVTWPVSVLWPSGTAPTMTTGAHTDIYTFVYDGTNIYGTAVQNY